jgi:hypothetical protein
MSRLGLALAAIEEVGLATESDIFSLLVAAWSKIGGHAPGRAVSAALTSTRPHAYVPSSLPVLMKKLQAVRHAGDRLISAVEYSLSTPKGVAAIP